jgi:NADH dehydrogenase FAD-containing subunit
MDSLHKIQEQVKAAKSIVIGGAGPTGVEAIAELGYEYGKTKKLTIITSGEELLVGSMPTNIAKVAENELTNLSVEIVKGTKITEAKPIANGKTELTLSNGEKILTDLYLPTVGIKYNSEFIPKTLLSATGEVEVDHFLKLKGAENIWAAGDITNLEASQFVYAERQATALAKILDAVLKGKEPVAYKVAASRMMGLSLGRSKATGRSGTSKIPSIIIWWFSELFRRDFLRI